MPISGANMLPVHVDSNFHQKAKNRILKEGASSDAPCAAAHRAAAACRCVQPPQLVLHGGQLRLARSACCTLHLQLFMHSVKGLRMRKGAHQTVALPTTSCWAMQLIGDAICKGQRAAQLSPCASLLPPAAQPLPPPAPCGARLRPAGSCAAAARPDSPRRAAGIQLPHAQPLHPAAPLAGGPPAVAARASCWLQEAGHESGVQHFARSSQPKTQRLKVRPSTKSRKPSRLHAPLCMLPKCPFSSLTPRSAAFLSASRLCTRARASENGRQGATSQTCNSMACHAEFATCY